MKPEDPEAPQRYRVSCPKCRLDRSCVVIQRAGPLIEWACPELHRFVMDYSRGREKITPAPRGHA